LLHEAQEVAAPVQQLKETFSGGFRALNERLDRHIAEMERQERLSERIEGMDLPPEQVMLLYGLLTLPPEALGLLQEHLGIVPRLE